jgi:hypothetical protein
LSLRLEEHAKHLWPPFLEVVFALESAIQQSLDSLLRFRPRQHGPKRGEGVEEAVCGWQRDLVNKILFYDWNWSEAEKGLKRTQALDPNNAGAHDVYSAYLDNLRREGEYAALLSSARKSHEDFKSKFF